MDVHPHYMSMFRIDRDVLPEVDRDLVVGALVAEGIPAFIDYKPIYRTRAFWVPPAPEVREEELAERCPQTERLGCDGIWLHHRVLLGGEQEVADTAAAIEKVLRLVPRSARASA